MKNLKFTLILLTGLLAAGFSHAQTIEDGKKFLYYEKFISAKNVFQQLVTANPNNDEATYWLGQAMIGPDEDKDIEGAKAVYQKGLAANPNSALLKAGMGHIGLLQDQPQQARADFETAISLSGGKNILVLDAIGRANGDFDIKAGDAAYAVEKLQLATTQKGFKDARVMTDLGDAYRKLQDGGNAQIAYAAALTMDPKYARAKYRAGRIYQSQGPSQEALYIQYYNDAIALDPNYAPVYFTLHQYYYETDVVKSANYLEKYLAAKGTDEPNSCFLSAQMKFAQGLNEETVRAAEACIASSPNPYPNLYGLLAYANFKIADKLEKASDSVAAMTAYGNSKIAFDNYFKKQKPAKLGPRDYFTYATVLLKFPGNEALAGSFMQQAVDKDSTEAGKVTMLKEVATTYEKRKQYADAGEWYKKILDVKKTPTKTDIFNAANSYYRIGQFAKSADLYTLYTQKFPDDVFGYYMIGKSMWGIDTVMKYGLANNSFAKVLEMGEANPDKSKIIPQLMGSYKYMFAYSANILRNKELALSYADKALLVDPNDAEIKANRDLVAGLNNLKPDTRPVNTADKVVINPDGSLNVTGKDGSSTVITNTGKITTIKDGITTIIENGKVTMLDANGKVINNTPTPPKPGAGAPKPPTKPAGGTKKK